MTETPGDERVQKSEPPEPITPHAPAATPPSGKPDDTTKAALRGTVPALGEDQARWLAIWLKAEDVAVHFNELILNFRFRALQALGLGAGVMGSVLVTRDEVPLGMRFLALACALGFFGFLWAAAWFLDHYYYQRLLGGAVEEIIRLEGETGGAIQLSTKIRAAIVETEKAWGGFQRPGRQVFYLLPAIGLAALFVVSGVAAWRLPKDRVPSTSPATSSTPAASTSCTVAPVPNAAPSTSVVDHRSSAASPSAPVPSTPEGGDAGIDARDGG